MRLQLVGVALLDLFDSLVRAEERVLRHVGRIPARRRMLADRFGERSNVMRASAAADAEIPDAHRERLAAEFRDLEPVAGERIERDRERTRAFGKMPMRIAQRLERRLVVARAV